MDETTRKEVALYMENANEMLSVAQLNYELGVAISKKDAQLDLNEAQRFVNEVDRWLTQEGWI